MMVIYFYLAQSLCGGEADLGYTKEMRERGLRSEYKNPSSAIKKNINARKVLVKNNHIS